MTADPNLLPGCAWEDDGQRCGKHRRSKRSRYCELHRGIAREIAIARIRERALEAQGRREEAEHYLEQATAAGELAASRMAGEGDGLAWVEVRPANSSFAWHAKREGWQPGPRGGIRLAAPGQTQAQREGYAVAAANALRAAGVSALAALEPAWR